MSYLYCLPNAVFMWTVKTQTSKVVELCSKLVTLDESRVSAFMKWNVWNTCPSTVALGVVLAGTELSVCARSAVLQSRYKHHDVCAAAAAKSLQLCPTLCDPRDGSPPGSPVPGILQARALEWGAIAGLYCSLFQVSCPRTCMVLHLPQSCPQHQFWLLASVQEGIIGQRCPILMIFRDPITY